MLGGHHEVGGQHHLESAAYGHAVDRRDHRLEQAGQLAEPPEAALAVVGLELLASGRRVEVPARAEEAVACAGEYRDPQIRIVAEGREHPAQLTAGSRVDGVGLGPIEGDLEHRPLHDRLHRAGRGCLSHGRMPPS